MNIRILIVTHAGGSPYHGPNMRWYYLGHALKPLGIDVEVASSSFFHKYITPPKVSSFFNSEKVNQLLYHWVRTPFYKGRGLGQIRNQFGFVVGCFRAASHLAKRKPHIVISSSPHPFVNYPAAYIANKAQAVFMYEVRDLWPELLLELGNFSPWHPYMKALKIAERYGVKNANRIISVKPGDWEYFSATYKYPQNKFHYVPNGFLPEPETNVAPEKILSLRKAYPFLCGYAGALSTYYGLDHLLELARILQYRSEIGFVIVGKGDRQEDLIEKANSYDLKNIHFIGAIPKSSVSATLSLFDVCYAGLKDVNVHKYGISCNKIYEYMHAGKPILGSFSAGYDPIAAANCGIVAPPGDYKPLVDGLEKMIDNPSLCAEYGKRAKAYFDANHDFRVVAENFKNYILEEKLL